MEFSFRARTKSGKLESGVLDASSRREALSDLRAQGLLPVFLSEKKGSGFSLPKLGQAFRRVTLAEKLTFIKNLSVMLRSGVSVSRSLKILAQQTTNKKFQKVISEIARSVEGGQAFSKALAKHPDIFSGLYVSLVEVGEAGGNLDQNLDYLHTLLKREYDLVRKTKGALTYPLVVLATLVLVGVLMFIFVLPKLTSTFTELNVELPALTRALIALVDLFSKYSVFIIAALVVGGFGLVYFFRTPTGVRLFNKTAIMLPVISGIVQKINLARLTLILSSLMKSGMQIVSALRISAKSLGNGFYSRAVSRAAEQVKVGVALSAALEKDPKLFPSLMTQMLKVGEESGTVEEILKEMGDYYEQEVDQIMKNLSSIIEPVLVVLIGIVVGVMAVALIMPIYSITQAV